MLRRQESYALNAARRSWYLANVSTAVHRNPARTEIEIVTKLLFPFAVSEVVNK